MQHQILIYGHDSILLRTRKLLLQRAGFEVRTADVLDDVPGILATWRADLLILCHTVGLLERSRILEITHNPPQTFAILFLVADYQSCGVAENDAVFSTLDGPYDFLCTVCRLTHEPAPAPFVSNSPDPGQKPCHDLQAR
jgi:hypothetical protein